MSDIEWRDKAACRGKDPELFFPLSIKGAGPAMRICVKDCPVRIDCGATALRTSTQHGVHGGYFLPTQRNSLRGYVTRGHDAARPDAEVVVAKCDECGAEIVSKMPHRRCRPCILAASRKGPRVLAEVIRPHLRQLRDSGITVRMMAAASGVHHQTVAGVLSGRALSVTRTAAEQLLAVTAEAVNA